MNKYDKATNLKKLYLLENIPFLDKINNPNTL